MPDLAVCKRSSRSWVSRRKRRARGVGGEGVEELVKHCFLFWRNGALRHSYLRQAVLIERVDEKKII